MMINEENDRPVGEIDIALARQRSFVSSAAVTFVLYWFYYVPGLVFNVMYLNEAQKVKKITGEAPSGMGCLYAMLAMGLFPLILFASCLGAFSLAASEGRERMKEAQQQQLHRLEQWERRAASASATPEDEDARLSAADVLQLTKSLYVIDWNEELRPNYPGPIRSIPKGTWIQLKQFTQKANGAQWYVEVRRDDGMLLGYGWAHQHELREAVGMR